MEDSQIFKLINPLKISLWTRIKLFFAKKYVSVDYGISHPTVMMIFKKVGGRVYFVGEKLLEDK